MAQLEEDKDYNKLYNFIGTLAENPLVTPLSCVGNQDSVFSFDEEDNDEAIYLATGNLKKLGKLEEYLGLGNGGWWVHPKKFGMPYDSRYTDESNPSKEQKTNISNWLHEPFNTEPILTEKKYFMERLNIISDQPELSPGPLLSPNYPKTPGSANIKTPKQIYSEGMPVRSNIVKPGPGTYEIPNNLDISDTNQSIDKSFTLSHTPQANLFRRDTFQMSQNQLLIPPKSSYLQTDSMKASFAKEMISEEDEEDENSNPLKTPRPKKIPITPRAQFTPLITPKPSKNPQPTRNHLDVQNVARTYSQEKSISNSYDLKSSNDSFHELAKQQEERLKSSVGSKYRSPSESKNNSRENLTGSNPEFNKLLESFNQSRHKTNLSYEKIPNVSDSQNSLISRAKEENENLASHRTFKRSGSRVGDFLTRSKENFYNQTDAFNPENYQRYRSDSCETRNLGDLSDSEGNHFFGGSYDIMDSLQRMKNSSNFSLEAAEMQKKALMKDLESFKRRTSQTPQKMTESSIENFAKMSRDSSAENGVSLRRSYDLLPKIPNEPKLNMTFNKDSYDFENPPTSKNNTLNVSYELKGSTINLRRDSRNTPEAGTLPKNSEVVMGEKIAKKPPLPNQKGNPVSKLPKPTIKPRSIQHPKVKRT